MTQFGYQSVPSDHSLTVNLGYKRKIIYVREFLNMTKNSFILRLSFSIWFPVPLDLDYEFSFFFKNPFCFFPLFL